MIVSIKFYKKSFLFGIIIIIVLYSFLCLVVLTTFDPKNILKIKKMLEIQNILQTAYVVSDY